jgi:hypothetical protein
VTEIPRAPIPSAYWAEPGRLLAGEYPGARDEAEALRRLALFRRTGIDLFLDLTEEGEGNYLGEPLRPYDAAIAPIGYRRMAIPDLTCPSHDEMCAILDTIDRALEDDKRVYVHCWGGVGRTGTVVGCWLVRHGRSPAEALALIEELRATTPNGRRRSPETDEQRRFIAGWKRGR